MARRSTSGPTPPEDFRERIVDIDVAQEMQGSFLEYAYSVIYSRALPDARDGLKPVHRRILYQMAEMGLRPDRGHVKCARVIGDVMGKLHPHGDGAIYDALVRMAQPWSMRVPLVDGHGNFGSLDDGPAAYRYTECRLAPAALDLVASLDEDVVDFRSNYDDQGKEPDVLPAAYPNLLVNGSSGIAVGMATNMAPHNLIEVVAAARHLIAHPEATTEDLMRFVPGPDLPTGGTIVGLDGIRDAYETGRGSFRTRATAKVENVTPRKKGIVVTELPYGVGPERVIEKIKEAVDSKKLQGISNVDDYSDVDNPLRLVIEIKNGFHPEAVLEQLYKLTPMEDSFGINNVALVDGQPRVLGLRELLRVYVDHRIEVVRRRTSFRRRKAADELHLVEGIHIAVLNIDEVIQVIRTSEDTAEARGRLMSVFDLSELQANYILERPLRTLTKYSVLEIERRRDELTRLIEELDAILGDESLLRKLVSDELADVAKRLGTPRRTVLLESAGAPATAAVPLQVTDDPCWVLLSSTGLVARTSSDDPIPTEGSRAKHDVIVSTVRATARGEVAALTSRGRMVRVNVLELPALPPTATAPNLSGGVPLTALVTLEKGEQVLGLSSLRTDSPGIALGTAQGVVKRVTTDYPGNRDAWEMIALKDGDEVVGAVELTTGTEELVFVTTDAQLLRFSAESVRPQGRTAAGMAGIRLAPKARVLTFTAVAQAADAAVLTVSGSSDALPGTQPGSLKVAPFSEYPAKGRGTGGVRCHRFLRGEDTLLLAAVGPLPLRAAAASGVPVELPAPTGKRDGSGTPGSQPIAGAAGIPGTPDAD
ncbi:MAG: DNA gyrase/topoisomerase IV subunit A [Actinomycetales bacterium]